MEIEQIYQQLLKIHGPRGWWPIAGKYHYGQYSFPKNPKQRFEICIGAILTQNTSWLQVEKALENLKTLEAIEANRMIKLPLAKLKKAIKPSGYFNQKAKKIKIFTKFFIELERKVPSREQLLAIWGIGPETADSILLYAYKTPTFVVDSYTKRILTHLNLIAEGAKYEEIRALFQQSLPQELIIYQEYHALIVEHAKIYYSKKPYGDGCPLTKK